MRLARRFVVALALAVSASACAKGSGSPLAPTPVPTPTPTPSGPVMAPPPPGVSSEVWRVGFSSWNAQLYRPKDEQIHLDVSSFSPDIQAIFAEMAAVATDTVQGQTTVDLVPTAAGDGANFKVSIDPNLICNIGSCIAGTNAEFDLRGRIMGGWMKFTSLEVIQYKPAVLHEIFRTFGISVSNPEPGIMSVRLGGSGWNEPRASDEERLMFLGRYEYPLLAEYSPN